MAPGRRIAPVDTIWLNMDRPENLMVIESLLLLEHAPDWDRVIDVIRTRLVDKYPVFRERPGPRAPTTTWPRTSPSDQVAALLSLIVTINAWNAIGAATRAWEPGSYTA